MNPLLLVDLIRWAYQWRLIGRPTALRWIGGLIDASPSELDLVLIHPASARRRYGHVRPRGER